MSLIELKKNPSQRELRVFGLLLLLFFALVGTLVYWHSGSFASAATPAAVGVLVAAVYYAVPRSRRWIYLGWLYAAFPIGWCVSFVLVAATYYLILTPVGLFMRLLRYDPMSRRVASPKASYWRKREPARPASAYFRQF